MWSGPVPEVLHVADQRDRLHCLAQAHLVGQDAVDVALVQRDHPVQAAHLVVPHLAVLDVPGRAVEVGDDLLVVVVGRCHQLFVLLLLRHAVAPVLRIVCRLFGRGLEIFGRR